MVTRGRIDEGQVIKHGIRNEIRNGMGNEIRNEMTTFTHF